MTTTLLTLDEAADRLHVSRRTVERLIHDGAIRPVRITPRRPRITERELDAFLASLDGRKRR